MLLIICEKLNVAKSIASGPGVANQAPAKVLRKVFIK